MKTSKKNLAIFILMIAALLLVVSCEYKAPVESPVVKNETISSPATFVFTEGTTIDKAELWLYVLVEGTAGINGKTVGVYKALKDWTPCVSWNGFYALSAPRYSGPEATFKPTSTGYVKVDITSLVQEWIDGGTNYGIFLKQIETCTGIGQTREVYASNEYGSNPPLLKITVNGNTYQETPNFDTTILEIEPTYPYCGLEVLYTGFSNDCTKEKQSLLIWDFDLEEGGGCTLTPGYWKTHSINGPAPYDNTWAQIGETTPFFLSGTSWYGALWTEPQGNPYWILAHAYIAAQLNFLNGADPSAAQAAFDAATTLFENNTPADAGALKGGEKAPWLGPATTLDNYNNGLIGPGHCD
ncbi:DNRLRE domain-containing protein [candidate division KSB1 bacterium]|nr:DNRLRE domain-containing protein [candidate division KSB1 bacterium]